MTDENKYIYVRGKKIRVSDEVYKAYKKELNHEAHLNRQSRKYKVYGFEDYKLDLNSIADEHVDIEKIIETKMRIEDLYKAFEEKTLIDSAHTHDTNLMKISRIRDKILRKLRDMLDR